MYTCILYMRAHDSFPYYVYVYCTCTCICTTQGVNVLGFKGPRKMTVVIPAMSHERDRIAVKPKRVRWYQIYIYFVVKRI